MKPHLETDLYIPERHHTVQVLGRVYSQQQNPREVKHLPR